MSVVLTNMNIRRLAQTVANRIVSSVKEPSDGVFLLFGIPRGGIPAAFAVAAEINLKSGVRALLIDDPAQAHVFIDDIVDSGATLERWADNYPCKHFFALIDKTDPDCVYAGEWVIFPWETKGGNEDDSFTDNVTRLLQFVGEDPTRNGLEETPARVAKAWKFWTSGYGKNPADVLKTFEDGADSYDQMVIVKDIPFYSHCEHHLAAIIGTATVAYIPDGRIVGLSKLSRVVDIFARRLQVQERLTNQIADAIWDNLKPKGVGILIKARHLCMESRGVCQQGHHTITSALRGVIKSDESARAEFLNLANKA